MMGELDTVKFLKTTHKVLSQTGHVSHESQIDAIIEVDGELRLNSALDIGIEHEVFYALIGSACCPSGLSLDSKAIMTRSVCSSSTISS